MTVKNILKEYRLETTLGLIALVAVFVLIGVFSMLSGNNPLKTAFAENCDIYENGGIGSIVYNETGTGQAEAVISNNSSNCNYEIRMASYKVYVESSDPKFISSQTLHAETVVNLAPGEIKYIKVNVPSCRWQADIFMGPSAPKSNPDFDNLAGYTFYRGNVSSSDLPLCGGGSTGGNQIPTGSFDLANNAECSIIGWVVDPDDMNKDVEIKIYSDLNLIKTSYANKYRADLERGGICPGGTCAFGEILDISGTHEIIVNAFDVQTKQEVGIGKKTITCGGGSAPQNQLPEGYFDSVDNAQCAVVGWTADPDDRNKDLTIKIYADGNLIKTATANGYRADVENSGKCPGGTCAFGEKLNLEGSHSISVQALDAQTGAPVTLAGSPKQINCQVDLPPSCDVANAKNDLAIKPIWVNWTGNGNEVEATSQITNTSADCTYKAGLASYEAFMEPTYAGFDEFVRTQKLFDQDLRNIGPGQTVNVKVALPKCTVWQVDLFAGPNAPVPPIFDQVTHYSFDAEVGGTLNSCPVTQPDNLSIACTVSPYNPQTNQTVTFSANASGGTGNYSYDWNGAVNGSGKTKSTSFSSQGTYTATVTVSDGQNTKSKNCSVYVKEPYTPPTTLTGSCQASPSSAGIGETVTWRANASGGSGSYTYSWSGAVSGNSRTRTATYNTAGTKTAQVVISDGNQSITKNCNVNIEEDQIPNLTGACNAIPSTVNEGETVTWRANPAGGTGSYTYSWSGDASGTSREVSRTYNNAGTYQANVRITSGNQHIDRSCNVTVVEVNDALGGTCSASPSTVNVGETVTWRANPSGGNGSYSYNWSGAVSGNDRDETTSYGTTGTRNATVTITSDGETISRTCSVNVIAPSLSVSCSSDANRYRVDYPITWTAHVNGGTGSYDYDWDGSENLYGDDRVITKTYDYDGTKNATVTVTSGDQTASATCQVNISDDVVYTNSLNVNCYANPTIANIGQNVNWYGSASGGNGNYNYYWSGTDNLSGNYSSVTKSYATSGNKRATLTVVSGSQSSSATCNINVSSPTVTVTSYPVPNPNPLSYVYLDQIPYTGLKEDMGKILGMMFLLIWSAALAFMALRWKNGQYSFANTADKISNPEGFLGKTFGFLSALSPYQVTESYGPVALEDEEIEDESVALEEINEDVDVMSSYAASRNALVSRQILSDIYDHAEDVEEAKAALDRIIESIKMTYPREDGWIIVNSERIKNLG